MSTWHTHVSIHMQHSQPLRTLQYFVTIVPLLQPLAVCIPPQAPDPGVGRRPVSAALGSGAAGPSPKLHSYPGLSSAGGWDCTTPVSMSGSLTCLVGINSIIFIVKCEAHTDCGLRGKEESRYVSDQNAVTSRPIAMTPFVASVPPANLPRLLPPASLLLIGLSYPN